MKMRSKSSWLGLLGVLAVLGGVLISLSLEEQSPPHGEAPSLQCFSCHGPHPPRNAEEIDLSRFALPPHAPSPEVPPQPGLTCSDCHSYPEELEEINENSCVGCHSRGGYPIEEALGALIEEGHPDVLAMITIVPMDCFSCHQGSLALGPRLHRRHLFESEKFMLHFETGCVRCHLIGEDGKPTIESYPLK